MAMISDEPPADLPDVRRDLARRRPAHHDPHEQRQAASGGEHAGHAERRFEGWGLGAEAWGCGSTTIIAG